MADTGEIITALHEAVRTERSLAPKLEEARREKHRLILEAKEAGLPVTLIAQVIGTTESRVYGLIDDQKKRQDAVVAESELVSIPKDELEINASMVRARKRTQPEK